MFDPATSQTVTVNGQSNTYYLNRNVGWDFYYRINVSNQYAILAVRGFGRPFGQRLIWKAHPIDTSDPLKSDFGRVTLESARYEEVTMDSRQLFFLALGEMDLYVAPSMTDIIDVKKQLNAEYFYNVHRDLYERMGRILRDTRVDKISLTSDKFDPNRRRYNPYALRYFRS